MMYLEVAAITVPDNVRFDVPRPYQGQIVEVAWGTFGAAEAGDGDPYKRITDTSTYPHEVTYYRLARPRPQDLAT